MSQDTLFPLARFDAIDNVVADRLLLQWGHWLGECDRPFGRQSFALSVADQFVSVCVSASTVNKTCGGWARGEVVELARLCSAPTERWATRVTLRLWRELGPSAWPYWPVAAAVSYQNALRHSGDVYRFDGWTKVAEVKGSAGGGTWTQKRARESKAVWVYVLGDHSYDQRREIALRRAA